MTSNYKAPPPLSDEGTYERLKKEVQLWQTFTNLAAEKMAPAICLALTGRAREAVLDLDVATLNSANGVTELLAKLDGLYLKDEKLRTYNAYDKFEQFKRDEKMSINDYLIDFEKKLSKIKQHGIDLPDAVLAYRVLKSTNIDKEKETLAMATVNNLTYDEMKKKLRSMFDSICFTVDGPGIKVKQEENEDVF